MGVRRAGHRTLGQPAVNCRAVVAATALPLLFLGGCSTAADVTALIAGGAAGGATGNPAVGYAVAVGTDAAADYAFKYYGRLRQRAEQNAIAAAAGNLAPGQTADWRIRHDIPVGNEHGRVQIVRVIDTPLASCREIAFSVADPPHPPSWFDASICRQSFGNGAERWKWATAEPAVERWGYLQ
jgi:hypothetical protein